MTESGFERVQIVSCLTDGAALFSNLRADRRFFLFSGVDGSLTGEPIYWFVDGDGRKCGVDARCGTVGPIPRLVEGII